MSTATAAKTTQEDDGQTYLTADEMTLLLLQDLAGRYKGIDPEVDQRLNAAAEQIFGVGAKYSPDFRQVLAGKLQPFYMEGSAGVGKTSLTRAACQTFCEIAGLNFVEEPKPGFVPGPKDFYYATINLSGKANLTDFGGMLVRNQVGVPSVVAGAHAQASALVRFMSNNGVENLSVADEVTYSTSAITSREIRLKGDLDTLRSIASEIVTEVAESAKKAGMAAVKVAAGAEPKDDRISYEINEGKSGITIALHEPQTAMAMQSYICTLLPNARFDVASRARFGMVFFDEMDKTPPGIRSVILQVAQEGRVSGMMDTGACVLTFAGNMGKEDNNNSASDQQEAEITRMTKVRIFDTPKNWAKRTEEAWADKAFGACYMPSMIMRQASGGLEGDGIFMPVRQRGKKGVPTTNARALENAIRRIAIEFAGAQARGHRLESRIEAIRKMVGATAGKKVADYYVTHMKSMLTEALPMAEACIRKGAVDEKKFAAATHNFVRSEGVDFAYRFAEALCDTVMTDLPEVADGKFTKQQLDTVKQITSNYCHGLDMLAIQPEIVNFSVTRLSMRLLKRAGYNDRATAANAVAVSLNDAPMRAIMTAVAEYTESSRCQLPDRERFIDEFTSSMSGCRTSKRLAPAAKAA